MAVQDLICRIESEYQTWAALVRDPAIVSFIGGVGLPEFYSRLGITWPPTDDSASLTTSGRTSHASAVQTVGTGVGAVASFSYNESPASIQKEFGTKFKEVYEGMIKQWDELINDFEV